MTKAFDRVPLRTGGSIPVLGLGVWQSARGAETRDAVKAALRVGYRHIDTARIYENEADVGAGMKESDVPRAEIFVTTKLWNSDQGYDRALKAFDASLVRLGLDYVDLYLIHWPVEGKRKDSWRALEKLRAEGRARAIGVSNFMIHHLEELAADATELPSVNQVELSPFLQHRDLRAYCASHQIVVEAYSPLTRGEKLAHPTVVAVAQAAGKTPAQVLLRWGLDRGCVILPKSVKPARIAENADLDFTLDAAALDRLDGLEEGLTTGWDPRRAP